MAGYLSILPLSREVLGYSARTLHPSGAQARGHSLRVCPGYGKKQQCVSFAEASLNTKGSSASSVLDQASMSSPKAEVGICRHVTVCQLLKNTHTHCLELLTVKTKTSEQCGSAKTKYSRFLRTYYVSVLNQTITILSQYHDSHCTDVANEAPRAL